MRRPSGDMLLAATILAATAGCTLRFAPAGDGGTSVSDAPPSDAPTSPRSAVPLVACPASGAGPMPFVEDAALGAQITALLVAQGSWGTTRHTLLVDIDADRDLDVVAIDDVGLPPAAYFEHTGFAPNVVMESDLASCAWSLRDVSAARLPMGPRVERYTDVFSALAAPIYGRGVDLVIPSQSVHGDVYRIDGSGRWAQAEWEEDALGQPVLPGAGATAGDVDGDGLLDVVVRWELQRGGVSSRTRLVHQVMAGGVRRFEVSDIGYSVAHAWIADLDGTPELELLTTAAVTDTPWDASELAAQGAHVYRWSGSAGAMQEITSFGGLEHVAVGGHVALGDVDLDGDLDLVQLHRPFDRATQTYSDAWRLDWLENTRTAFVPHVLREDVLGYLGGRAPPGAVVDVDLDGFPDVLLSDHSVRVLLSTRTDASDPIDFRELVDFELQKGEAEPSFGDADGDGDIDVLVPGQQIGSLFENRVGARVYLGTATEPDRLRLLPEVDGVPAYGAEVCVYRRGELPEGDVCGGPMLAYAQMVLSTSSSLAPEVLLSMRGVGSADVRVRWASRGGARDVTDYTDLAPGSFALPRP